ncbi:GntR family transcriptional regulator [Enterococcus faecalis]|nr:GntR family transcriptional regulator [Enterococcus faecalis]EGO8928616.1 GntR family transcriptional regulator [Enterococcus faecalis]EGO9141748.1 GntR family transcriptional regulator [Enterococcus faecalis]PQB50949.1 hypothetical protein CUN13_14440 [Enterococcus faecalis]
MSVNSFDDYSMSWRPKLKRNEAPLYINLANQLERDIASGDLRPGTKLPPQRELADFLDGFCCKVLNLLSNKVE